MCVHSPIQKFKFKKPSIQIDSHKKEKTTQNTNQPTPTATLTMLRHSASGMMGRPPTSSSSASSSKPPPTSNRRVQSNSVQTQFLTLTRDNNALRAASEVAERDRLIVEQQLQELRGMERTLFEDIRKTQGERGSVCGQLKLLKDEKARLQRQIEQEKRASLECTNQAEDSQKLETQTNNNFVIEMKSLNEDMETMLQKHEDIRLMKLVSMDTIEYLRDKRFKDNKDHHPAPEGFHQAFEEAVAHLKEAITNLNYEKDTQNKIQIKIEELRAKILHDNPEVRSISDFWFWFLFCSI